MESTYGKIVAKIKKYTGIDTISVTLQPFELIVDDTSGPTCLYHTQIMYDAPLFIKGNLKDVGLTIEDLEDLGLLTKLFRVTNTDGSKGVDVSIMRDNDIIDLMSSDKLKTGFKEIDFMTLAGFKKGGYHEMN